MSNATALAASAPSMASVPPLSMSGLAAFWACFAIAGAASGLFGSMVMYKSHSAASKVRAGRARRRALRRTPRRARHATTHRAAAPRRAAPRRAALLRRR
jgi:hypothetical protein